MEETGARLGVTTTQSLDQQLSQLVTLQNQASATGPGTVVSGDGYTGAIQVEVTETAGGTATVVLEGSMDGGTNWYAVGYQQVDGIASPARSTSSISVAANSAHVYQVLDPYRRYRARISAISGTVTVRAYLVPA